MIQKYLIPLLALVGVVFAVFTVIRGDKTPPPVPAFSEAPQSPYRTSVAASGLVEASTENISIGTSIPGIVAKIFVQIGGNVKAGDPLFMIDDRALRSELAVRVAAEQVAEAQLADANYNLTLAEALATKGVGTIDDREKKRFVAQKAAAQRAQARAEVKSTETDLERLTVRAPVDGRVLQAKAHLGEFAPVAAASVGQPPLILLGSVTPLHVRVDVDENDAWRVTAGAAATGYLRGRNAIKTPLMFVRFEPYVVPKKSLTGDSTERVDTRVLQVLFSFEPGDLPIYVGQQMDVFIEASAPIKQRPVAPSSTRRTGARHRHRSARRLVRAQGNFPGGSQQGASHRLAEESGVAAGLRACRAHEPNAGGQGRPPPLRRTGKRNAPVPVGFHPLSKVARLRYNVSAGT